MALHLPEGFVPLTLARRGTLRREWEALASPVSPFLGPDPVTLQASLAPNGERLVAMARIDGALVGVLPIIRSGHTLLALRSLESQQYDFLGDERAAHRLLDVLARDPGWGALSLTDLPVDSPLVTAARTHGALTHCAVHEHRRSPLLVLPGFEHNLTAKFRANLRRCERKLPGLVHERITRWDRQAFEDAMRIEGLAWKDANGSSIHANPDVEHAYRALCRWGARRGVLALHFLRFEGRRVATMISFEHGRTLYAMKLGHDPALSSVSVGQLMVWHLALDAEQRGFELLDFLGRDDDWKRHWTEKTKSFVTLDFYRGSAEGLARWMIKEELKPTVASVAPKLVALARNLRDGHRPTCQRQLTLAYHPPLERLIYACNHGLGIKSGVKNLLDPPPPTPLGRPSQYAVGSLVRVRSREALARTLDERTRTRGLLLTESQWEYCDKTFRVEHHVRHILDDRGRFRSVHATALLEGVDCGGPTGAAGCGRHCPLWFRDEWLEPAHAADAPSPPPPGHGFATVKSVEEIRSTLDRDGRHDGVLFTADIAARAGRRLPIQGQLDYVFEHEQWLSPRAPVFLLSGAACSGTSFGDSGPCNRACPLMWHRDWLTVDT